MNKEELRTFVDLIYKIKTNKKNILNDYALAICDEDISRLYSVAKALDDYYV